MNCPICENPFNLKSRQPLFLLCGDTVCSKCSGELNNSPQNGTFQCSICKEILKCDNAFIVNKFAIEIIKKNQKMNIYCSHHPLKQVEYYCKTHKSLICRHCVIQTHADHKYNLVGLKREDLDKFNKNIHEKLTTESNRICNLISDISSFQEDERNFSSEQYMSMITEAQETLGYRMKTEEEKKSLYFLDDIPAMIIQPQPNDQTISQGQYGTLISELDMPLIRQWIGNQNIRLQLIYRASVDSFKATKFHEKCDNQGPMISFIQNDLGKVFGGYTSVPWQSPHPGQNVKDDNAFIFSLTHKAKHTQYQNQNIAVHHQHGCLQNFGRATDIYIENDCNLSANSHCNIGYTYKPPDGIAYDTEQSKSYLSGQYYFKVTENEVYKVIGI